jgi:hypothetical protein
LGRRRSDFTLRWRCRGWRNWWFHEIWHGKGCVVTFSKKFLERRRWWKTFVFQGRFLERRTRWKILIFRRRFLKGRALKLI